jgi:hypothetical protein
MIKDKSQFGEASPAIEVTLIPPAIVLPVLGTEAHFTIGTKHSAQP